MAQGHKKVETRSRPTHYRGELLIHSAKRVIPLLEETLRLYPFTLLGGKDDLPLGFLLGKVFLLDCVKITEEFTQTLSPQERAVGDYTPGRYAWILKYGAALPVPIPYRGQRFLFEVPDAVLLTVPPAHDGK